MVTPLRLMPLLTQFDFARKRLADAVPAIQKIPSSRQYGG
jgi:hypothetical protein